MDEPAKTQTSVHLWAIMVSCGLDEEFEYDWLGRIKHKQTSRYIRIDAAPEFVEMLVSARASLALAGKGAANALSKTSATLKQRLLAARAAS